MSFLTWIIVGLIAGVLASLVMGGTGYGLIGDIIIGIVGAFVGGWIFSRMGVSSPFGGLPGDLHGVHRRRGAAVSATAAAASDDEVAGPGAARADRRGCYRPGAGRRYTSRSTISMYPDGSAGVTKPCRAYSGPASRVTSANRRRPCS